MGFDAGSIEARATVDRTQFNRDLEAMKRAAREFQANPIRPQVHLATAAAQAELDKLKAKLAELERREYKVRVRVDQDQFRRDTDQVVRQSQRAGQDSSKGLSLIRIALEQGLPPAIALAGGVAAIGVGLIGAGITGVIAFKGIQTEIKNNTALGKAYKTDLSALNIEFARTKQIAAAGLFDGFNKGVATARQQLPGFNQYIGQSSRILGDIAQHGLSGVIGGFKTFNPLMLQAEGYVATLSQRFDNWANGPGGAQFGRTLSEDLDHAIPALEQLVTLITRLVSAANPIGHVMLDTITALAKAINSLPVGVLSTLLASYLAFRTVATITAIVDRATLALGRLAVAETAAAGAGGAGGAAGAAGAGAVLGRTGKIVRGTAIGAILGYLGGNALKSVTPDSMNEDGTGFKGGLNFALDALGDLLTGHWTFGTARGDLEQQYRAEFNKDLAADLQRSMDEQYKAAFGGTTRSGGLRVTGAQRDAFWQHEARDVYSPQLGATPQGYRQQVMSATNARVGALGAMTNPEQIQTTYAGLTEEINKSITASQKWFDTSHETITLYSGLKVSAEAYYKSLQQNNGDQFLTDSVFEQRFKLMNQQKDVLRDLQTEQKRYDDFLAGAAGQYGLTAQQAGVYAAALGLTEQKITATAKSSDLAARAVGLVSKQLANGDVATQQWLATISQLDLSTDSLSNRVTILGAGLQALQGTTNAMAGANLSAASSAETAANALKANHKSVSEQGRLLGQLVKHGKDWEVEQPKLTAGSLEIQQAFAGAGQQAIQLAQSIYANERATKGNAQAVKDAFGAYEGLRRQFISTAEGMGYTNEAAHKLANQIYGIPDKDFEKSLRVGNLPEALAGITDALTNLNDNLSSILIRLGIDVNGKEILDDTYNKIMGLPGTKYVNVVVTHGNPGHEGIQSGNTGGGGGGGGGGGRSNDARSGSGLGGRTPDDFRSHALTTGGHGFGLAAHFGDPPPSLVTTGGGGGGGGGGKDKGGGSDPAKDGTNTRLLGRLQGYLSGLGSALGGLRQYIHPVDGLTSSLNALRNAIHAANAAGYGSSELSKQLRAEIHDLKANEQALADDKAARDRWRAELHQDRQARRAYATQVSQAFSGQFNATSGNGYAYGIKASLNQAITTVRKFRELRKKALAMGLDERIVQMYEQAGPDGEKALEAIVSQGKAYVKDIDRRYEKLSDLSKGLGQTAGTDRYGDQVTKDNKKIADLTEKIHDDNKAANHELKQIGKQIGEIRREIAHAVDQERKK